MAYKSLLIIISQLSATSAALEKAISLARDDNAHLEILCLGVDRTQSGYYYGGADAIFQQDLLNKAGKEADEIEAHIQERLAGEDFLWTSERVVTQLEGVARIVAHHARFSDLVILPQPYGTGRGIEHEAIVEAALFAGNAPTIIVPPKLEKTEKCGRIIIAWNESSQCMTAVRGALPALQQAELVNITVIDPPSHGISRSDPGGQLAQFLARHGVKSQISVLAKTLPRVSDVLIRHARDIDADMFVMGAYGHSRFREALLGGATRNMLEKSTLPILMAHA